MKKYHQLDQKMYRVEVLNKDNYFVIAYSEVHAIIEVVNMNLKQGITDFPGNYDIKNVYLVDERDMEDIIIDYNYAKDTLEKESLFEIFTELTAFEDGVPEFYGVVGDDFVDYGI
jgi:hypothetical protein